jgi:hypothetical protein
LRGWILGNGIAIDAAMTRASNYKKIIEKCAKTAKRIFLEEATKIW